MTSLSTRLREGTGQLVGKLVAPIFGVTSALRQARTFHPRGRVLRASVARLTDDPGLAELAKRLEGPAIVRLSAALWKRDVEHLEVLGLALRLRSTDAIESSSAPGDQDLLFATIRSPVMLFASPLFTDAHDFFKNRYWGVAPFDVPGLGSVKLRLVPDVRPVPGGSRGERLTRTIARGDASFTFEVRRTLRVPYEPFAKVRLLEEVTIDQTALRFSPFQDGRGIVPRGFLQAIRRRVYRASQDARPH